MSHLDPPTETIDKVRDFSQLEHDHIDYLHDALNDLLGVLSSSGPHDSRVRDAIANARRVMEGRPA